LLSFWGYLTNYGRVFEGMKNLLIKELVDFAINEISVASDDEYLSLIFIKAYRATFDKDPWSKVSLHEDGTGLYFWTRQRRKIRHLAKLCIDNVLLKGCLPRTLGYFSGNALIRKIYAVCPELVPNKIDKEIVDISNQFRNMLPMCLQNVQPISPLPPASGIILSERSRIISGKDEIRLIRKMISFLKNECGIKNIYVKYHHFDPPSKKEIYNALGVREISSPNLPYEILHPYLNPEYVVSVGSAALFYCSLFENRTKFVAFCREEKSMAGISKLYRQRGIIVV
jgi:hypothetical protein